MTTRKLTPSETVALLRTLRQRRLERLKRERQFFEFLAATVRPGRLRRRFYISRRGERE